MFLDLLKEQFCGGFLTAPKRTRSRSLLTGARRRGP